MGCTTSRETNILISSKTDKGIKKKIEKYFYKKFKERFYIISIRTRDTKTYYFLSNGIYNKEIEIQYDYYIQNGRIYNILYNDYIYICKII